MSTSMGCSAVLWIASLLFSPDGMSVATQKSTVSLNPPWNRIFKGENVTLTCDRNKFLEVNSTTWFHNNITLAVTNSRLDIIDATTQDSGEYKCQSKNFNPSQSVHLEVFSDWLLIQSSPDVVKEGEPFLLRCHGWMNRNVYKVIYYKNDVAFKYWYENHNISITKAKLEDSGIYYCSGILWKINYTSDRLNITVQKGSNYYGPQLIFPLLVVILFVVDTGLFISTQQQFTFLLKIKRTRKGRKLMDPHPKPDPQND